MSTKSPTAPPPVVPPEDRHFGGGRSGWALLRTVSDLYEAELIRGLLESEDLGPVILEPVQTVGAWMLPSGHARIPQRIYVLAALVDAAQLALLESGFSELEDDVSEDERYDEEREPEGGRGRRAKQRIIRWAVLIAFGAAVATYLIRLTRGSAGLP